MSGATVSPQADATPAPPAPEEDPATPPAGPRPVRTLVLHELAATALTAVVALACVAWTLRLWASQLDVPFWGGGDALLNMMLVKNMQLTGWMQTTPLLGAPFGQNLAPWPGTTGDLWNLVALKVLSSVLSPAASMNVFYVLSYPVVAAVAYLCLRGVGVSRLFSVPLGVAYALLPYHFLRNEPHMFLGAYYAVPVACLIAVWVFGAKIDLFRRPRLWSWREWVALGGAVVLVGGGIYYAVFALVLLVAAMVLGSIATRTVRPLVAGVVLGAVVVVGLALAALPTLLYTGPEGAGSPVAGRSYAASEFYGLKITNLILPAFYHRVQELGDLAAATGDSLIPGEGTEALGLLGVVGLVAVVLAALLPTDRTAPQWQRRLRTLGMFAIISILVATVAGINSLFALVGFGQVRAWNRMSVVIAFLALAGLGILLDLVLAEIRKSRPVVRRPVVGVVVAAAVVGFAVFDQTSPDLRPDHAGSAASWDADDAYFGDLQRRYGAGTAVFQLPYVEFPEAPAIAAMPPYDHLRGYLHSDLAWSYGGVKGQESAWQPRVLAEGTVAALPQLVVAGFDALYVNRNGYDDHGALVESEILGVIGPQTPVVSTDGAVAVYDLRPYAARLEADGTSLPPVEDVLRR